MADLEQELDDFMIALDDLKQKLDEPINQLADVLGSLHTLRGLISTSQ